MQCLSAITSLGEIPKEHFSSTKNIDRPGVWVFPILLVCLDCGLLQSIVPAAELALLAAGIPIS